MVFKRYASPFEFLDTLILAGNLEEYADFLIEKAGREIEVKTQWDYYLHRIYDKSFKEFSEDLTRDEKYKMDKMQVIDAVDQSQRILKGFIPKD